MNFKIPEHLPIKSRANLVALICGSGMTPIGFWTASYIPKAFPLGFIVLVPILALCVLAGVLAAGHPDIKGQGRSVATYQGGRVGARAGILTAFLAGGICVLACVLLNGPVLAKSLPASASILPGMLIGMIGGGLAARSASVAEPANMECVAASNEFALSICWPLVLGVIGFASPLFPAIIPQTTKPVVKSTPAVSSPKTDPEKILPPPPPPKPWTYERPANFSVESPEKLILLHKAELGKIRADAPTSLSADGNSLAYFRADSAERELHVMGLNDRQKIHSVRVTGEVKRLCFSMDGNQIFALVQAQSQRDARPLHGEIYDLKTGRVIKLPNTDAKGLPDGQLRWWADDEVAIRKMDGSFEVLFLETLQLGRDADPKYWTGLTDSEKGELKQKWTKSFQAGIEPHLFPVSYAAVEDKWKPSLQPVLALANATGLYRKCLEGCKWEEGDVFLFPDEGARVIQIQQSGAQILYFAMRLEPKLTMKVTLPCVLTDLVNGEMLKQQINEHRLSVFICEALTNPINGNIVGPDRTQVKAVATVLSWEGTECTIRVVEENAPIKEGQVIADLHYWAGHSIFPITESKLNGWWTSLDKLEDENQRAPVVANSSLPGRVVESLLNKQNDRYRVIKNPYPDTPTVANSAPPDTVDAIKRLLHEHHQAASSGDINKLMSAYADEVWFLKGRRTREEIHREETAYHVTWPQVTETISSPIEVKQEGSQWVATYTVNFHTESPAGAWSSGKNDIEMILEPQGQSLVITSQKARIYDRENGSKSSPKETQVNDGIIAPSLPKPCWTDTHALRGSENMKVVEFFAFINGRIKWHRHFCVLGKDGKLKRMALVEHEGLARQEGATLRCYPSNARWILDKCDPSFIKTHEDVRSDLNGTLFFFVKSGADLRDSESGVVFKAVP